MSQLAQQRRRQHATRIYDAGFEAWRVRPVFVVQVFTWNACWATNPLPEDVRANQGLRFLPAYRTEPVSRMRLELSRFLRQMRRAGLTAADVRRLAITIIDAPTSYADELGAKIRREAREQILKMPRASV